ncbi:proton-coupled folate transporter-like isoform X2 [Oratosquilla oratoria]|uniref:proton-coupled folate transporter-like isoform X2 n=1 Tax=Oratosquilla oratoria TaxID=337810 RepID=UPI003F776A43
MSGERLSPASKSRSSSSSETADSPITPSQSWVSVEDASSSSYPRKILGILGLITLEPTLFLQNLCSQMVWVISQDLMMEKACKLIFVLYLGSWSDHWGRKIPFIICLTGLMGESVLMLVNALEKSWKMEFIFLTSLPFSFGGGTMAVLMLGFSYLADKTTAAQRTLRVALMDAAHYLGAPAGLALIGPLYDAGGFIAVFSASIALYVINITYVILRIKEQRTVQRGETDCYRVFSINHLISGLKTTFTRRPAHGRAHILALILAMFFNSFAVRGQMNVKYLFVKKSLDWDTSQYGNWGSFSSLITLVGAFLVVPLLTLKFGMREGLIGLVGAVSTLIADVIYANVVRKGMEWLMYFGSIMGSCHTLVPVAIRSLLSKIAGHEEVGQIYAVMATGESVIPFASSPAYRSVYQATKTILPGAFFYLSGGLNLLIVAAFIAVTISMAKNRSSSSTEELHTNGANSAEPTGRCDVMSQQTTTRSKINGVDSASKENENCINIATEEE